MSDLFRERMTKYLNTMVSVKELGMDKNGILFEEVILLSLKILLNTSVTKEMISKNLLEYGVILSPLQIDIWMEELDDKIKRGIIK